MSHCYFRLFVVFEITIIKIAMFEIIEKYFVLCNEKVFFSRVLFTFYSSSFPGKYFLLVLRYFFQVLFLLCNEVLKYTINDPSPEYANIDARYLFEPVAVETLGVINTSACHLFFSNPLRLKLWASSTLQRVTS